MTNQSLAEQLKSTLKEHPEVIVQEQSRLSYAASLLEMSIDETGITVTSRDSEKTAETFKSMEFYFQCLLQMIKSKQPESAWTIRYASQIIGRELPFLLEHTSHTAAIDPMAPYRNAIRSLSTGEPVFLVLIKAKAFYAKKRELVKKLNGGNNNDNGQSRKKGPSSPQSKGKYRGQSKKGSGTSDSYRPPEVDSDQDSSTGRASVGLQPTNE